MSREEIARRLLDLPLEISEAEEELAEVTASLVARESHLIRTGEITGKNEMERKAGLAEALAEWETAVVQAKLELHLKQNTFAALRSVARLLSAGE